MPEIPDDLLYELRDLCLAAIKANNEGHTRFCGNLLQELYDGLTSQADKPDA